MSTKKCWELAQPITQDACNLFPELSSVMVQLLWNRGIRTQEDVDIFLYPDYSRDIHDPMLFRDMQKAVERLFRAIARREKIIIHGDYDADGVCACALLATVLEALGSDNHEIFIPHREKEGYGLNQETIKRFSQESVKVVVTVDCGIVSFKEVKYAQSCAIDVIITDHHTLQDELPQAFAIIHPRLIGQEYPNRFLAGVGVAFKLAQALIQRARTQNLSVGSNRFGSPMTWKGFEKWLLDLVGIATITDMMPLTGENRVLVKYGLVVLSKTRRAGLLALMDISQVSREQTSVDSHDVGFRIGPRLNATGRLDSSVPSLELLMAASDEEAKKFALLLNESNTARQKETERIVRRVEDTIKEKELGYCLCMYDASWMVGVVGLAAGRLMNTYYRPVLLATKVDGKIRGSGRSIKEFNLMTAMNALESYLEHYGGHAASCGFTLKDEHQYEAFVQDFSRLCQKELESFSLTPTLLIDAQISLQDITWNMHEHVMLLAPFGQENPQPLFLIENVTLRDARLMGKNNQHVRLTISDGNIQKQVVGFGCAHMLETIKIGDRISLVVEISKNVWNGNARLELILRDWKVYE